MFFLLLHTFFSEIYPQIFTIFILGSVLYVLFFIGTLIILSPDTNNACKKYATVIVMIDIVYLIYQQKYISQYQKNNTEDNSLKIDSKCVILNPISSILEDTLSNMFEPTIDSELNDFKVEHESSPDSLNMIDLDDLEFNSEESNKI